MNNIIQQITDWLKGLLVLGIMNNLTNTFSSVNDQVGQIATEVGQTPSSFLPAVFNMVRNLSETVIMPIAGILLTFIACYELIQLIISYNNLASFETWFIWKWIFKTFVAVELITHTFDITMAVFDVSQSGPGELFREAQQLMQAPLRQCRPHWKQWIWVRCLGYFYSRLLCSSLCIYWQQSFLSSSTDEWWRSILWSALHRFRLQPLETGSRA